MQSTTESPSESTTESSSIAGAVVGGIVGVLIILIAAILIALVVILLVRRRQGSTQLMKGTANPTCRLIAEFYGTIILSSQIFDLQLLSLLCQR